MTTLSSLCARLLADARAYGPLFGPGFSNHLPMALIALERMGAPPEVLERFAAAYAGHLLPAGEAVPVTEPLALLGRGEHFAGLARFFEAAVAADGEAAVLRQWLPVLMPGLAAAGFHAMIRLAYALEAQDRGELCAALAFWVLAYKPLPVPARRTRASLDDIAARLAATTGELSGGGPTIGARMAAVERSPALAGAQPEAIALADVAAFALRALHASADFMLLHTVTACHAFRRVAPYCADSDAAVRQLWQAVLVAWLAAVRQGRRAAPADIGWDEIERRAICSTDDHVIKLCWTARAEHAVYGDARYVDIAARAVSD